MKEKDHIELLKQIDILLDKEQKTIFEIDLLNELSQQAYEYEKDNYKIERPNFFERIRFRLNQKPIKYYFFDFVNWVKRRLR